jgi:taurine dioxygenase
MTIALADVRHPMRADFTLEPLTPSIGARVDNIDLTEKLDERAIGWIADALMKHKVLVFRDQRFTPETQRDFAACFGRLHVNPISPNHPQVPEIMVLHVDRDHLPERAVWHTDVTFDKAPPMGAVLHCVECPSTGGDTIWSSTAAAFSALSPPLRQLLDGLTAEHEFAKLFRAKDYAGGDAKARWEAAVGKHPPVIHPVVRSHPVTGEKAIFINEGFTTRIIELAEAESDALLSFLFSHMTRPEFTYRHRWSGNDVVFWDNRVTAHYPVSDYWPNLRRVHRATIL